MQYHDVPEWIITNEDYWNMVQNKIGVCHACGSDVQDVDICATQDVCPSCGEHRVKGAVTLVLDTMAVNGGHRLHSWYSLNSVIVALCQVATFAGIAYYVMRSCMH